MSSSPTERSRSAVPGPATLVDVTMPQMGVSVAEGTLVAWRVEVGDRIEAEETICEISTDKIDTEIPAPVSGVVAEILVGVETTVTVGAVLARIATGGGGAPPAPTGGGAPDVAPRAAGGTPRRYSPIVQRIAAEHGVNLEDVPGTGRDGRVRKQDVLAYIRAAAAEGAAGETAAAEEETVAGEIAAAEDEAPLHIESPYRPEPEPADAQPAAKSAVEDAQPGAADAPGQLPRMRRQIGEHMKRSLETAAHCTTWIEVDMSRVESARARLGVTALAFVAQAAVASLREHPALNAWLERDRYTRHADVNLGIAVSLGDDGLIVPVIHKAHELSAEGLAARLKDLARRARARELSPDEVHGGTFTITNPGQYGSIMATPIINQPQVAILDFEAVVKRPVVVSDPEGNESIAIRPITILGLSWDHRALDGAQAAQFLATMKRQLEAVL